MTSRKNQWTHTGPGPPAPTSSRVSELIEGRGQPGKKCTRKTSPRDETWVALLRNEQDLKTAIRRGRGDVSRRERRRK